MELVRNCQDVREVPISLPVLDHFYASLYAELLCSNFSRNYGIVLADIIVNLLRLQFWEHSRHFLVTFERYACNIRVASLLHFQYFQIIFLRSDHGLNWVEAVCMLFF